MSALPLPGHDSWSLHVSDNTEVNTKRTEHNPAGLALDIRYLQGTNNCVSEPPIAKKIWLRLYNMMYELASS